MKKLLITLLAVMPLTASADYDAERIKNEINETQMLQINGWHKNEAGNAWIADHALEQTVISVGEPNSGLIAIIADKSLAISAMLNCMIIGNIGLDTDGEQAQQVVTDAVTNSKNSTVELNNVVFSVTPEQIGNVVSLSCIVSPST